MAFIEFCWRRDIVPFCFIPHPTHGCQPLDGAPFQVLKHYYKTYNNNAAYWGGGSKYKAESFAGIHVVRTKALTKRSIRSGFRETRV
jgi:hypothetical protein